MKHHGLYTRSSLSSSTLMLIGLMNAAHAAPQGGHVVGGVATISHAPQSVTINQQSDRTVIDWRSFDVGAGESVRFNQPSSSATALNRIADNKPSAIDGAISANGNVILSNPNGVIFGQGATVDVNSLIATSADIDTQAFLNGSTALTTPGRSDATVINNGHITAKESGLVGLVAPHVENNGTISARLGRVQLASGDTAIVDLYGDGLMGIEVSDAVEQQLVSNSGTIRANGGTVQMTAAKGRDLVDSLLNVSGTIQAASLDNSSGRISLSGATQMTVSGQLSTSGVHKGGVIHVGGEFKGGGVTPTATFTTVTPTAKIAADASHSGDGGEVIVWADDTARVAGTISATGAGTGSGGFVETSGSNILDVDDDITVDTGGGTWLLDPTNITITTDAGVNNVDPATIITGLTMNNVVVHTDSGASATGSITVEGELDYDSPNDLSILAQGSITIRESIVNDGDGDINIVAGWDENFGFMTTTTGYETGAVDMSRTGDGILNPANSAYGNNNRSIRIGNVNPANTETYVGSKDGTTRLAARTISVIGGGTAGELAAIGYKPKNSDIATGDIELDATNSVSVVAGDAANASAFVGVGGSSIASNATGDITINALTLSLDARNTTQESYARIGHGHWRATGMTTNSGDIVVNVRNLFTDATSAGTDEGFAQIGHGTFDEASNASGDINLSIDNNFELFGGNNAEAYAMIGHGSAITAGDDTNGGGDRSGHITVLAGGSFRYVASGGIPYIGHLTDSGTIGSSNVRIAGIRMDYDDTNPNSFNLDNTGLIDNMKNNLTYGDVTVANNGNNALNITEEILLNDADDAVGNLTLLSTRAVHVFNNIINNEDDQIADNSSTQGAINIIAGWDWDGTNGTGFDDNNDTTFDSDAILADNNSYGNNGSDVLVNQDATTISVALGSRHGRTLAVGDDIIVAGTESDDYAQIGAELSATGDIIVHANRDLTIASSGTVSSNAYARIGHGVLSGATDAYSGDIDVRVGDDILIESGNGNTAAAKIGHGNIASTAGGAGVVNYAGNITVVAQDDVTLHSQDTPSAFDNYAGIGHGDDDGNDQGTRQGDIVIISGGELSLVDDDVTDGVEIGHRTATSGGITSNTRIFADALDDALALSNSFLIDDTVITDIIETLMEAGSLTLGSIGNRGITITEDIDFPDGDDVTGNLTLLATRDIDIYDFIYNDERNLVADGSTTQAQINVVAGWDWDGTNGTGFDDVSDASFDIAAVLADDTSYGNNSGHVEINRAASTGPVYVGSRDGQTAILGDDITLQGGNTVSHYSQIGARGNDVATGDVIVRAKGDLELLGGAEDAYARIGHGELRDGSDNISGAITVVADALLLSTGTADVSAAKIGHGNVRQTGGVVQDLDMSGAISVTTAQNTTLRIQGGAGDDAYAAIGHGEDDAVETGTRTGNITVISGGELSLVDPDTGNNDDAYIGHRSGTAAGVTSNVNISAGALDSSFGDTGVFDVDNADFVSNILENLSGGDVTITSTGANNVAIGTAFTGGTADNTLTFISGESLTLGANITNNDFDLDLQADDDVVINNTIDSNGALDISATNGDITLNADIASEQITFGGAVTMGAAHTIDAGQGLLTIGAGGLAIGAFDTTLTAADYDINGAITGTATEIEFELPEAGNHSFAIGNGQAGTAEIDSNELDFINTTIESIQFFDNHNPYGDINIGAYQWRNNLSVATILGAININGSIGMNAFKSASFSSEDLSINALMNGGSNLLLFNHNNIGDATGDPDITDASLANIGNGWDTVTISSFTGDVVVNTATSFANDTSFRSGGDSLTINGALHATAGSDASFAFENSDSVLVNAPISSANGDGTGTIRFANIATSLALGSTVTTNDANITLADNVAATTLSANAAFDAGAGTITIGANGIGAGARNLSLTSDELVLNGNIDGSGALTIKSGSAPTEINVSNANAAGLDLPVATLARIGSGTMFDTITIGDASHTGTINLGAWTPGANLVVRGGDVAIEGALDVTGRSATLVANTGSISQTAGGVTANAIALDAVDTIVASVTATTSLDIGSGGNSTTLMGALNGDATQLAANAVTGGPGQDPNYTFNGFTIRVDAMDEEEDAPAAPDVPVEPQQPDTDSPNDNDNDDDSSSDSDTPNAPVIVTPPQNNNVGVRVPRTVEQVSQNGVNVAVGNDEIIPQQDILQPAILRRVQPSATSGSIGGFVVVQQALIDAYDLSDTIDE